jgi:GH24 family phage-related lysozyme (muramidase)
MIEITDSLKNRIRLHEGCVLEPYEDSLGKLTVAIGHLVQPHERKRFQKGVSITQEEANELFEMDLNRAAAGADVLIDECIGHDLPQHVGEVIVEMVFQLGTQGVRNFSKMWKNMRNSKWKEASDEMKDSRWHSQTPKRCESLAEIIANT